MKVNLKPAYHWDCPCGASHYFKAETPEISAEDRKELMEHMSYEDIERGHFYTVPKVLLCDVCLGEFEVETWVDDWNQDGDDFWPDEEEDDDYWGDNEWGEDHWDDDREYDWDEEDTDW